MSHFFLVRRSVFALLLILSLVLPSMAHGQEGKGPKMTAQMNTGASDREFWLVQLDRLARPILSSLANDDLRNALPAILSKRTDNASSRTLAAPLEAFGRILNGIAPWLNGEGGSPKEIALRQQYREWVIPAISHAVNPAAKDYMSWGKPGQALVDASFFAFSFLRCPWLWEHLHDSTRRQVVEALRQTRGIKPGPNNWLLFSGMIEAFFCHYGFQWDPLRVDYCLRQLEKWYVGDGVYSDGASYHWDYYNSFVIHPYLAKILETVSEKTQDYAWLVPKLKVRSERYAVIQERLINTDGSYPITGRSIVYRGAAFHHLADMAWRRRLPAQLSPAQVRCALTAVLKKTMESPSTFTKDGWLNIGVYGSQPDLADVYNTTGSLYLCSDILLPLGLPATDEFWSAPPERWTAQKIWSGMDIPGDHSID
ncbi:MAG TPA: DUF2264 domain-containing protein [Puia sp.]|nr:DUF2264 domain-containing protein [Puia sp.]